VPGEAIDLKTSTRRGRAGYRDAGVNFVQGGRLIRKDFPEIQVPILSAQSDATYVEQVIA